MAPHYSRSDMSATSFQLCSQTPGRCHACATSAVGREAAERATCSLDDSGRRCATARAPCWPDRLRAARGLVPMWRGQIKRFLEFGPVVPGVCVGALVFGVLEYGRSAVVQ